jgi:NAD(P)H dehydrogenase (quinone)
MYAVIGVTGNVGGAAARALLAGGQSVRAVVRNPEKGQIWKDQGCEIAFATIEDEASLTLAFQGAEAVFVLVPSNFDPSPGFSEAQKIGKALHSALAAARPKRLVYLSTIGAGPRNEPANSALHY